MDNNANMMQLCRLCLVKDEVNIPIFEEQGDIRQIFLKISSCLPVKVSREDKLPKKICDGCSYKLDMLYEFWNTSANAEKQLLSWLGEAGMSAKMNDGHMSAVAQQIKPNEALVKEEELDPSDLQKEEEDDDDDEEKSYMFQQKLEENNAGPSATATSNEEEEQEPPPPKRARRTAAVKAAIAMDHDSDDDDDSGEPLTKIEDESEESDCEDAEPAFVDAPSTSADDQAGPSGVGKDGADAPSCTLPVSIQERLKRHNVTREIRIKLIDLKYNNNVLRVGDKYIYLTEERRKTQTCYVCMEKFRSKQELSKHKQVHVESDIEDDLFEEDYNPQSSPAQSETNKKSFGTILPPLITLPNVSAQNADASPNRTDTKVEKSSPELPRINCDRIETPFRCITCDVFFHSADDAKLHLSTSIKCKFACRLCNRQFNTLYAFVVHVMQHEKKNSKSIYTCSICQKSFDDCFSLKRHGIISHNTKTVADVPPKPQMIANQPVEKIVQEPHDDSHLNEQLNENQFTCDLCYDIFQTAKELANHTEFHKQLEMNSEPIVIDDDDEFVEVIEDTRDKHEIITTIQKAKKIDKTLSPITAATSSPGKKSILSTKIYQSPNVSKFHSNQALSAKIQKMLGTDSKKVSKTILLPRPIEEKRRKRKSKQGDMSKIPPVMEVKKTGPLSFSVVYKDQEGNSSIATPSTSLNTTPIDSNIPTTHSPKILAKISATSTTSVFTSLSTMSTSSTTTNALSNLTYIMNNSTTPSLTNVDPNQSCIQLGDNTTQYAYVIIPHNNPLMDNTTTPTMTPTFTEALFKAFNANTKNTDTVPNVPLDDNAVTQSNDIPDATNQSLPLITDVTSLATEEVDTVATTATTTETPGGADNSRSLLRKSLTIPESLLYPFSQQATNTKSLTESSNMPPVPNAGPTETILIDSDTSSNSSNQEQTSVDKNFDETEFPDKLVIDETVEEKPNVEGVDNATAPTNCPAESSSGTESKDSNVDESAKDKADSETPKRGMIFVKKMEDLLAPKALEQASKSMTKKWKFPIKCSTCSTVFHKYRTMRLHNHRKHKCFNCDYTCCRIIDLKNHYKTEHQLFLCRLCKFLTDSATDSGIHHSTHVCQKCTAVCSDLPNHKCSDNPKAKKTST